MAKTGVLIVEDEANLRAAIREILQLSGYEPSEAVDGREGLAKADALRPALILLDIEMPGLDGYEICRRLKANPSTAPIPVILMTGSKETKVAPLAFEAGAAACLMKPFGIGPLMALIKEILADPARRVQPQGKAGQARQ